MTTRQRERDIVDATRAAFDQRGMQDAPIEEIARAVGIARGLIYRHFSSKEELYVLTVTDYLSELEIPFAYSSVYDRYAMKGGDLYTRDEARVLKQWDTRKPFPGFDPKLGSKTLDIYSED